MSYPPPTFWDQILDTDEDVWDLIHYGEKYNYTNLEIFQLLRMYFFRTPIRRSLDLNQKPRHPAPNCVRITLYSGIDPSVDGVLARADFPLEPNGDLKTDQIRSLFGVNWIMPTYSTGGLEHTPARDDVWSGLTIYNLTDGRYNLNVITDMTSEQYRALPKPATGWRRELQWTINAFHYDPGWYFNYLFVLCVMYWLASLVPDAVHASFMLVQLVVFVAHALFQMSRRSVSVSSSRIPL